MTVCMFSERIRSGFDGAHSLWKRSASDSQHVTPVATDSDRSRGVPIAHSDPITDTAERDKIERTLFETFDTGVEVWM